MDASPLHAISPVDGRYASGTKNLKPFYSEAGLIQYRIRVEVAYLFALAKVVPNVDWSALIAAQETLTQWSANLPLEDIERVKTIEKTTNHDVKAVEYCIKEKLDTLGLQAYKEWVHFGLTSQDINNTAIPLSFKEATHQVMLPAMARVLAILEQQAQDWKDIPMLAKTHGQPASPTRLGKEWYVFVARLESQINLLANLPFSAKFGGATGNYNAHQVAFPQINWPAFGDQFVGEDLGLYRVPFTTQIEPYDFMAAQFDSWKRINNILIDFSRDVWTYVSMEYFKQKIKEGEVGSSAMPHKVNPIDFENAEGNLGIANALFEHLAAKLPISRLQRDLTDSTVLRNLGVPFGHTLIALNSLERGLNKLLLNEDAVRADLGNNWAVVAEAIQTVLRREGYPNPYETLKELTRTNSKITESSIATFINELNISDSVKHELRQITPFNYTGTHPNLD
ncbi:MAG: adenylosuccinate lyase [Bacteroidetes bacterium]|nr:adenylosuccinate lyase [Bacteroidota bacterium]